MIYRYVDKITKKYPDHKFYYVKNVQEGLKAISTGKIDIVVVCDKFITIR